MSKVARRKDGTNQHFNPEADLEPDRPGFNIHNYSDEYYRHYAKTATEELATFTSSITP